MGAAWNFVNVRSTFPMLAERHYLGPTKTADFAWQDANGVLVFGRPRGRNVPPQWLELLRWCLSGEKNAGSRQWKDFLAAFGPVAKETTTIISYSDPSHGHTGALYRACNWLWAPTWHRLRPPPSGNGAWTDGERQEVKDRWIYPVREEEGREAALRIHDESLRAKMPWAEYREPRWKKGKPLLQTGGGDYKRFIREQSQ